MIVSVCNPTQGLASLPPEMTRKVNKDCYYTQTLDKDLVTLEMVGGIVARQLVYLYCSSTDILECAIFHKTLKLS